MTYDELNAKYEALRTAHDALLGKFRALQHVSRKYRDFGDAERRLREQAHVAIENLEFQHAQRLAER